MPPLSLRRTSTSSGTLRTCGATARAPDPAEQKVLRETFDRRLVHYKTKPDAAKQLVSAGESPRDDKLDVTELAAYTTVASMILNLDETITK